MTIDKKDDAFLASLVKNTENQEALNLLISRHSGICYKIYNKYFIKNYTSIAKDVEDQKDSLIYQAAKTYDPSCGTKFSTWLGNVVTYACLNACNLCKKEISLEENILKYFADSYSNNENSHNAKNKELISHIENIVNSSSDKASKEVIKMRYLSGDNKIKTFKEIADHFGVSTQTIVNWHDKFINYLRNKLKSDTNLDIIEKL